MQKLEPVLSALITPTAGTILAVFGIILALVLGFNQHRLNSFTRKRYIKSIKEKISLVSQTNTLVKFNLHTASMVFHAVTVLILVVFACTSLTIGFIGMTSTNLNDIGIFVSILVTLSAVYSFYQASKRLVNMAERLKAMLVPMNGLREIEEDINKNSASTLLTEADRQELLKLIDKEKTSWLLDEKA